MKMFSDCIDCKHCHSYFLSTCIAGHGDDLFYRVTESEVLRIMDLYPTDMRDRWKYGMDEELKVLFPAIAHKIDKLMQKQGACLHLVVSQSNDLSETCLSCGKQMSVPEEKAE